MRCPDQNTVLCRIASANGPAVPSRSGAVQAEPEGLALRSPSADSSGSEQEGEHQRTAYVYWRTASADTRQGEIQTQGPNADF